MQITALSQFKLADSFVYILIIRNVIDTALTLYSLLIKCLNHLKLQGLPNSRHWFEKIPSLSIKLLFYDNFDSNATEKSYVSLGSSSELESQVMSTCKFHFCVSDKTGNNVR